MQVEKWRKMEKRYVVMESWSKDTNTIVKHAQMRVHVHTQHIILYLQDLNDNVLPSCDRPESAYKSIHGRLHPYK